MRQRPDGASDSPDDGASAVASSDRMLSVALGDYAIGQRADKAVLAAIAATLGAESGWSRSRVQTAIADGRVHINHETLAHPSFKIQQPGVVDIELIPVAPSSVEPEPVAFSVLFEDDAVIVVDKPAGVATHPAPGSSNGTLVNGLLHHCGPGLFEVGGGERPGIVHRLDRDTSGVLVVAKADAALHALQRQFVERTVERRYRALCWGAPDRGDPRLAGHPATTFDAHGLRIEAHIGRHPTDRKRMAVRPAGASGARNAATRVRVEERFGRRDAPFAAQVACTLETGRTHQIRVHLSHIGHPLIGDPVYGRARKAPGYAPEDAAALIAAFRRQALHAETLVFDHPITGERLAFAAQPPADFIELEQSLQKVGEAS